MFNGTNDKSLKMGSDFNILDMDDTIIVGDQSEFATTGYIYQILLNGKKFGLWNFRNTSGKCKGQKRDKSEVPDTNLHLFFSDGGYKVYGINKQLVPRKLSLSFDIKTFDENSLIYLAATEDCQQYIILYLENGYAKFTVSHGGPITNTQKSDNKVNNGQNYEIEITMNYKERNSKDGEQQYNLIVRFQERTIERQSNKIALNSSELVKIRRAQHFLGGLPPTFEKTCVKLNVNSFLGYLKPKTPLTNENVSYGISLVSDKVLEYTYAWVNTNGVIILNTSNVEIVTLRFVLKPIEPNGIVFKLNGKQIIYLQNSRLVLENVELVDTDETFLKLNDYNDIEIAFVKKKYISINGKKLNLPYFDKIYMEGYLQIGDLKNGFNGGIREIIINDELLPFNPTFLSSFSKVDIGRDKEISTYHNSQVVKSLTVNPNFSNFMQNTEGCAVSENYKIEVNSVKFGDEQNSYVHIKTNFWKSDYVLGIEFRTLFPNGLIFISNGFKQQSYIILEVRDNKIHLDIKGKRKHIPVIFNKKVSDGKWHKIQLNKKKRKLLVTLDKNIKKPVRIPKIAMRNEVYFGGYPQESDIFKNHILHSKLVSFHGCMRYLTINDDLKILEEKEYDKNIFFSNTGQCFTNIEDGAYFAGNGHVIYDKRYLVSDVFEVSFEFRTTEQNGIIFILSHPKNSPAFSLELQNGALVMAVDNGSGAIRYASNNLDSDFALCNNQWHNVTTLYSTSELTVIVDGIRKTWVQPESNSVFDKYESALYIGGIPLDAPTGTLKGKENFNGCLRKLKIGNISVNWPDVNELHNVSLNSCPSYPT